MVVQVQLLSGVASTVVNSARYKVQGGAIWRLLFVSVLEFESWVV